MNKKIKNFKKIKIKIKFFYIYPLWAIPVRMIFRFCLFILIFLILMNEGLKLKKNQRS